MRDIVTQIEALSHAHNNTVVVGINGLDCAGKTTFTQKLASGLTAREHECLVLHVDDYNNIAVQEQVYRAYAVGEFGSDLFDRYYHHSIDYGSLALAISAARQDRKIVLVEGVFLFRPPVSAQIDYKVFLEIEPDVARARYVDRKLTVSDERSVRVFDDIWMPAFERYCKEYNPHELAQQVCSG